MPKPNESICSDDLRKRILSLDINPGSDLLAKDMSVLKKIVAQTGMSKEMRQR